MDSDGLKHWIQRLDQLTPSDGILTQSIVDAVGNPPMGIQAPDGPLSREEAQQLLASRTIDRSATKAYLNTTIDFKINRLYAERRDRRSEGNAEEEAKLDVSVRYWKSIVQWVQRL
jgi:hypothetical protein